MNKNEKQSKLANKIANSIPAIPILKYAIKVLIFMVTVLVVLENDINIITILNKEIFIKKTEINSLIYHKCC